MDQTYDGDVIAIDTYMHGLEGITAVYYLPGPVPAIIETGPATSFDNVVRALEGYGDPDIQLIVVTHIHLDHAGAVGHFAKRYPNAKVIVRVEGAPHLVDPSRLWASASRIYADMEGLWGEMLPVEESRVLAVSADEEIADLGGGRKISAFHTPGHAFHQMALLETSQGDLFTGDAIGVYLTAARVIRPATPPPEFDLELGNQSVEKLRALKPTRTFPTHFGQVPDQEAAFDEAIMRFNQWVDFARPYFEKGAGIEELAEAFKGARSQFYPELQSDQIAKFEQLASYAMNAAGILRYLKVKSRS